MAEIFTDEDMKREKSAVRSISQSDGREQFLQEVFPAELDEINKRRRHLDLPEVPSDSAPSNKLDLTGLALSGGGIRSATFSLGVIQALAQHGVLTRVDYLSTVSGGGFIGSCLSSLLNDKNVGSQPDRFPLRYEAGTQESLAVGQLRQGARYLAPGGFLDKLRILALILRGVVSNLLIFTFLILIAALVTEFCYEVGNRLDLRFRYLALGVLAIFVTMVVAAPLISWLRRGSSTWAGRNLEELTFTIVLVVLLFVVLVVPALLLIDQFFERSWSEFRGTITTDLLRPLEQRDYLQWLFLLALVVLFMFAGRASKHVAQWSGKIVLLAIGLIGPVFLFLIYISLLVLIVDSPFITPRQLFHLEDSYADRLDEMHGVSSDLRRQFRSNNIRLAGNAQVVTLDLGLRWLVHDSQRSFVLERDGDGVSVMADFKFALDRGRVPPELHIILAQKEYRLSTQSRTVIEPADNRFRITGSHVYWIEHDANTGVWSLEQVVSAATLAEVLRRLSLTIQISKAPSGVLMHENVSLSDDDLSQAIRFVGQTDADDVVLLVDNSAPPFADQAGFRRTFRQGLQQALRSARPTTRLAVFWFDDRIGGAGSLEPMTSETKQALNKRLFPHETDDPPGIGFQGQRGIIRAGLERALRELRENGRERARKSIVLISDGVIGSAMDDPDTGLRLWMENEFAPDARSSGIRLFGIALSARANFDLFAAMARKTEGEFFPVFESDRGPVFQDLLDAMQNLQVTTARVRLSPADRVTLTDRRRGTRYTLTLAKNGVRLRADLRDNEFAPLNLDDPSGHWRNVFRDHGVQLGPDTKISKVGEARWEVNDSYRYTIMRSGHRLKIRHAEEDWGEGVSGLLQAGIPRSLWDGRTDWVLLGAFAILLVYWLTVNINQTAAHMFYRDKLSRAYLFRVTGSGAVEHHDRQLLSQLNGEGASAPYHLINVALNLQGSKDPSLRGRVCDFFIFSKRFVGSLRTGFAATDELERYDTHLDLATVMAISGAAAAPNAGVVTVKPLVFMLTLLNVRLGYWLPNPRAITNSTLLTRLGLRRGPGPKYILRESIGRLNDRGMYLNVSDGGHIENLGIFELLRRRCKLIIAVDGERDVDMAFGGLVKLLLYARIDMGIHIDIDLDPIRKNEQGLSSRHWAVGTIHYADGETGRFLYIKSSLTGSEFEYIRKYRSENPRFPHEPTGNQFFTEAQFEAYRRLGYKAGDELFSNEEASGGSSGTFSPNV